MFSTRSAEAERAGAVGEGEAADTAVLIVQKKAEWPREWMAKRKSLSRTHRRGYRVSRISGKPHHSFAAVGAALTRRSFSGSNRQLRQQQRTVAGAVVVQAAMGEAVACMAVRGAGERMSTINRRCYLGSSENVPGPS
jgi:hypothetical protein